MFDNPTDMFSMHNFIERLAKKLKFSSEFKSNEYASNIVAQ